jgi:hypothetical protein
MNIAFYKGKKVFICRRTSPDLNPDEYVNADVKYGAGSKTPKRTKEGLREAAEEHMNILRRTPKRIKRCFLDPTIAYAADV